MNMNSKLNRLEDALEIYRNAANNFELSRPELLAITGAIILNAGAEDRAMHERLCLLLDRHKWNATKKHGTCRELSIPEVFDAAVSGEEFCDDLAAVLARAQACGL